MSKVKFVLFTLLDTSIFRHFLLNRVLWPLCWSPWFPKWYCHPCVVLKIDVSARQIDYILCSQRWRSSIQSTKTRPKADCGSDHELLIAKFRIKLKKVGETTRPFRYDLNQIPYNYTVYMINRFKGSDLIDRLPEELWKKVCNIVQEALIKTIPKKKKC